MAVSRVSWCWTWSRRTVIVCLVVLQILVVTYYLSYSSQGGHVMANVHSLIVNRHLVNRSGASSSKNEVTSKNEVISSSNGSTPSSSEPDVHYEHPTLGHNLQHSPHPTPTSQATPSLTTVAIGLGLTTNRQKNISLDNLDQTLAFFKLLLKTFCETCSKGYAYHFFIAYDYNDKFLSKQEFLQSFTQKFHNKTRNNCTSSSQYFIHFVQCNHTKSPAWAQNDAMMEAYFLDMEYYYRVNDDTIMKTAGWTEVFIKALSNMDPPYVGVVGPKHKGGSLRILTYDFVSYRHVEIFGFYYPRTFPDWFADRWITEVYKPDRSLKLKEIDLVHAMNLGQRYVHHTGPGELLPAQLVRDKKTLQNYIASVRRVASVVALTSGEKKLKVVCMSLSGVDPVDTYGAVRNAQLIRTHLPEWSLRVYVSNTSSSPPAAVIHKLRRLGATLLTPPPHTPHPALWPYDVIDDPAVDYFLIREPSMRLGQREAGLVDRWLAAGDGLHCVRDLPAHASLPLVHALWGASTHYMRSHLNLTYHSIVSFYNKTDTVSDTQSWLSEVLWPRLGRTAPCLDSVSHGNWSGSLTLPAVNSSDDHIGQHYNQYGQTLRQKQTVTATEQ